MGAYRARRPVRLLGPAAPAASQRRTHGGQSCVHDAAWNRAIWGIYEARSLPRRMVVYALGFVAVPAMIGGAVYLTSWAIE
ncbi:MAG TPA: hypothetical protein VGT81_12245, partial [Casimicrobiaceae bacterium]|nr:hypothetical protein [Casimicrobiaceae bacterium]